MQKITFEQLVKLEQVASSMVDTLGLIVMQMTTCTCIAHERMFDVEAAKKHIQTKFINFLFTHDADICNAMTTDPEQDHKPVSGLCRESLLWARDETERFLGVKK